MLHDKSSVLKHRETSESWNIIDIRSSLRTPDCRLIVLPKSRTFTMIV